MLTRIQRWAGVMILGALASGSSAAVLYDNASFTGDANTRGNLRISSGLFNTTYRSDNTAASNEIVGNVTVPAGGWNLSSVSIYGGLLLGGTATTATYPNAYLTIIPATTPLTPAGTPNPYTDSDPITSRPYSQIVPITSFTSATYFVPGGIPSSKTFTILNVANLDTLNGGAGLTLAAGSYWIGLSPITSSTNPFGVSASFTDLNVGVLNSENFFTNSTTHLPQWTVIGAGVGAWQGYLPMTITGTTAPEPASLSLLLIPIGLCARRRGR